MEEIRITQLKSTIGTIKCKKLTMKALGLRKIRHSVVHKATPQIQGMVENVKELVKVEIIKPIK